MKKSKLLSLLSVLLLSLFLLMPNHSSALPFENLTEDVGRGFGDTWNRYTWSMGEFGGQVYVGTWNIQLDYVAMAQELQASFAGQQNVASVVDQFKSIATNLASGSGNVLEGIRFVTSQGAEIWRHDGGQKWTQVHKAEDPVDTGFRSMHEYDGYFYAGSANSTTGAKVMRSLDGKTWEPAPGWNPSLENNSIRTFIIHEDKLYLGTENNKTGGELWSYDGDAWVKENTFDDDVSVAELIVYKDQSGNSKLAVGTWDFRDSYNFYTENDSDGFDKKTPNFVGSDELHNLGVMKLIEYQGQIYLGTVNYQDGFTLLRTSNPEDPDGWKVITTDGMGDKSNAYTWSMAEYNDKLYMGTFNSGLYGGLYDPLPIPLDGRAQLLASSDGLSWDTVLDDGFGVPFTYGFRNMLVSDNRLFVGTASNFFIPELDILAGLLDGSPYRDAIMYQLGQSFAQYQGNRPWIGTQIWATPVPEPATMLLLGMGLAGIAASARRRRE